MIKTDTTKQTLNKKAKQLTPASIDTSGRTEDSSILHCSSQRSIVSSLTESLTKSSSVNQYSSSSQNDTLASQAKDSRSVVSDGNSSLPHLRRPKHEEANLPFDLSKNNPDAMRVQSIFQFENFGLVGRDKQVEHLKLPFHRVLSENRTNELVLIRGRSGTGKSVLARALSQDIASLGKGIFVEGKFDFIGNHEPYAAIAKAFGEIFKLVLNFSEDIVMEISRSLLDVLGSDMKLLMRIVPELEAIAGRHNYDETGDDDSSHGDLSNALERCRYSFRATTQVLSSHFSPMILFLDDLQWADSSSLQVLDYIISDCDNPNPLLIIGAYRSDEVDESNELHDKIQSLQMKKEDHHFRISEIDVDNFSVDEINNIIMKAMSFGEETKTFELAKLCEKRTDGNPYFVIQFLIMLEKEDLITRNPRTNEWEWDLTKIEAVTESTDNVAELLAERMLKMSKQVQLMLQYAAYLGARFRESTLIVVWTRYRLTSARNESDPAEELIAAMEAERFIERCGQHHFRWTHDQVQEAALSLVGSLSASVQLDLGSTLYYSLSEDQLEEDLFNVADLINNGNVNKRPEFAEINLRAARKARSVSAFQSAAKYAAQGIATLPKDEEERWSSNRSIMLELYTLGVELEQYLGNIEVADMYSNAILSRADCTLDEAVPLKLAKAKSMVQSRMNYPLAIKYSLKVLQELGYGISKHRALIPFLAIRLLFRTIKIIKELPKDYVVTAARMKDPKQKAAVQLIGLLNFSALHVSDIPLVVLCYCRHVELGLKYGIHDCFAFGLAGIGTITWALQKDLKTCTNICELALSVQKKLGTKYVSQTAMFAYGMGLAWTMPLEECRAPMLDAYTVGIRSGEIYMTTWNLVSYLILIPYMTGKPLRSVLDEFPRLCRHCEERSLNLIEIFLRMNWQMILQLMVEDEETSACTSLHGEVFSRFEPLDDTALFKGSLFFAEGELHFFSDYKATAKRSITSKERFQKFLAGEYRGLIETFHRGVALYVMARRTNQRKYKVHAIKIKKTIEKWKEDGSRNVDYYISLLNAEHNAMIGEKEEALKLFRSAAEEATRAHNLHHAALCNERYGVFLLEDEGKIEEGRMKIHEAIRLYDEWGCGSKARKLEEEYFQ